MSDPILPMILIGCIWAIAWLALLRMEMRRHRRAIDRIIRDRG